MEQVRLAGPLRIVRVEGGDPGDRMIVVAPNPHKRIEIPMDEDLARITAERLTMSDDELEQEEQAEEVEARRAAAAQHLGLRNGSLQ